MYDDGYDADLPTFEDKYAELSVPFEKILFRLEELEARPAAVESLTKKLGKVEDLMTKWETEKPHITEEERKEVLDKVAEVRKWLEDAEKKQKKVKAHEDPAFTSAEVPEQTKDIEALVAKLNRKKAPKPPKEEKKEEEEKPAAEGEGEGEEKKADDAASDAEAPADDKKAEGDDKGDDEL
jgi:hypoxia up-regulated 1